MKIALFALDEIFEGNEITCKELCKLYAKFSRMYIMSRKELYSEKDLKIFEVKRKELTPSDRKLVHCKTEGFGLSQIITTLDIFFDTSSQKSENNKFYIKIYDSVHLENGQILRITGEFQGKEWFANIAVTPAEDQDQYSSDKEA
ncbi:hypothetical protein C1646_760787 [Rhizophagus diaphanus]|nr:hypothetical protein C1646_760787 [Rhizophagus diaphanus] [Rhizophagus sp. MUCL 43196]